MNRLPDPTMKRLPRTHPDPALLSSEVRECQAVVANIFGYHSIQLSAWPDSPDLLATAQTISRHSGWVGVDARVHGCFEGHLYELPLVGESNALVVLHHVHELQGSTYGVLSELHRILQPEGIAVFIGINPWRRGSYWRNLNLRPVRVGRLVERLKAFDLRPLMVRPIGPEGERLTRWVSALSRHFAQLSWLGGFGQGYLVVARKKKHAAPIPTLRRLGLRSIKGRLSANSLLAKRDSGCGE